MPPGRDDDGDDCMGCWFLLALVIFAVLAALTGCAGPDRLLVDGEYGTDKTGAASAVMQWDAGPLYIDAGVQYDPELYGQQPRGVVRVGAVVPLK